MVNENNNNSSNVAGDVKSESTTEVPATTTTNITPSDKRFNKRKKNNDKLVYFTGKVAKILNNNTFLIELENGVSVQGYSAGNMVKNNIKVLQGDTVDLEMDKTEIKNLSTKGYLPKARVVFRYAK